MKRNAKIFCAALALVLVFGAVVGGTIAWLQDSTDPVVNTFTVGNVDITLTETESVLDDGDNSELTNSFKMVPGNVIAKDPTVTVEAGSEDCWIFVKVEESSTLDTYISYDHREGWAIVEGGEINDNYVVYGYESVVTSDDADSQDFYVLTAGEDTTLANGYVTVNKEVTKGDMEALKAADAVQPTLTFTAYAIQNANIEADTAAEAWKVLTTSLNS